MKLESCRKIAFGRCVPLEDTVARLEAAIGALHEYRLYEAKVSDRLFWSALYIDEIEFRSMGKGITALQAKAGALAECAEWVTAMGIGQLPGYTMGHQETIPDAVGIEDLIPHVAVTGEVIDTIKRTDSAMVWVDACSLLTGKTVKIPIEFIRRIGGPNGLAAGNRREEAIVHATNEVFERRVHITVLKQKLVMPTIDLASIEHPVIREQIDFVKDRGIEIYLKDLSFGGELPCVGAYFWDPNIPEDFQFHHFFKVGSSFDAEEALMRTFTEYAQGRRLDEFIRQKPEEQDRVLKYDLRRLRCVAAGEDNYLSAFMFGFVPFRAAEFLKEGDVVPFRKKAAFDDCLEDIEAAKSIIRRLGKDYLVVDFTDPQIQFPVIQVIVPGYSDVLPYYPASSRVLFKKYSRNDILRSYGVEADDAATGTVASNKSFSW